MNAHYLRVKDWKRHQHYRNRNPLWIKIYRDVIEDDDSAFAKLSEAQQWQLVRIWILASKCEAHDADGAPLLAYDETWIRRAIKSIKRVELEVFVNAGLLELVADEDRDVANEDRDVASKTASEPPGSASTDDGLQDDSLAALSYVNGGEKLETFSNEKVRTHRQDLWNAMVAAMRCEPKTRSARGAWNHAVKELAEAGATPGLLASAAAAYRRQWPNVSLTPTALAKHWHVFLAEAEPRDVNRAFAAWWEASGRRMSPEVLDDHLEDWRRRGADVDSRTAA